MKYVLILIFFSITFLFVSCGQSDPSKYIEEGHVNAGMYKSLEIGWSINIPEGWIVVKQDDKKGKEAMEKTIGNKIDVSGLKHLINFRKDPFNVFISTSEQFKEEYPGEFIDNN